MQSSTFVARGGAPVSGGAERAAAPLAVGPRAWPCAPCARRAPPRVICAARSSGWSRSSLQINAVTQRVAQPTESTGTLIQRDTAASASTSVSSRSSNSSDCGGLWLESGASKAFAPDVSTFGSYSSGSDSDDSEATAAQSSGRPMSMGAAPARGNDGTVASISHEAPGANTFSHQRTPGSCDDLPHHSGTAGWQETAQQLRAAAAVAAGMAAEAAAGIGPSADSAAAEAGGAVALNTAALGTECELGVSREPAEGPAAAPAAEAWLQRTRLLLGPEGLDRLAAARVLVVGLGGVGSYVAEFLVRAGVGHLAIVDGDVVDVTNKNRQLPALDSTVGQPKADVVSRRLLDINPHLNLVVRQEFLEPEASLPLLDEVAAQLEDQWRRQHLSQQQPQQPGPDQAGTASASPHSHGASDSPAGGGDATCPPPAIDWVVDCIDSIAPKLALVAAAHRSGAHVISSMGAGGRMDPLSVHVADISETYGDSFAAHVRRGLRKTYGIRDGVAVVFSTEPCRRASLALSPGALKGYKKSYYGTISFLPAIFGLQIAAHILNVLVDGPMLQTERIQRAKLRAVRDAGTPGASKQQRKPKGAAGTSGAAARRREKRQQQQLAGERDSRSSRGSADMDAEPATGKSLGQERAAASQQAVPPQQARQSPLPLPALPPSSWLDAVRAGDGNEGFGI